MAKSAVRPGSLYVVGTPIGNLEDISYRAVRILQEVEMIAAEDTRAARILLNHYQCAPRPLTSFFKGNEQRRSASLLQALQQGASVALISEAGMPGISDPGERLIQCCIEKGIAVEVIPGPNAALCALILSGLSTACFTFVGFLPRKGKMRQQLLARLAAEPSTIIMYEAPPRVARTLADVRDAWGERDAAVVREITKLHQEVVRDQLSALAARYQNEPPRGEVTLVIAGQPAVSANLLEEAEDLRREVSQRLQRGERPREIASALSSHGRRTVYQLALELQGSSTS
jgi:16S rRNA (cytidine1402-2'-O)-methyltransferase